MSAARAYTTELDLSPFNRIADLYEMSHADMPLLRLAWELATGDAAVNVLVVDAGRKYDHLIEKLFAYCRELKPMQGYSAQDLTAATLYWIKRRRPRSDRDTTTTLLVMALDSPAIGNFEVNGLLVLWHLHNDMLNGPHLPGALITRILPACTEQVRVYRVR